MANPSKNWFMHVFLLPLPTECWRLCCFCFCLKAINCEYFVVAVCEQNVSKLNTFTQAAQSAYSCITVFICLINVILFHYDWMLWSYASCLIVFTKLTKRFTHSKIRFGNLFCFDCAPVISISGKYVLNAFKCLLRIRLCIYWTCL